jgi:hypothetical protein
VLVVDIEGRQGLFSLQTCAPVKSTKALPHVLIPFLCAGMAAHLDFLCGFGAFFAPSGAALTHRIRMTGNGPDSPA